MNEKRVTRDEDLEIDLKKLAIAYLQKWWLILLCAILAGVCGLLLILRPVEGAQAIMILFGITLLFEGIMNILTAITAVKIIKTQKPDIIDVEYTDESGR